MVWGARVGSWSGFWPWLQLSLGAAALADDFRRPRGRRDPSVGSVSWVLRWNQIAIDASGVDHAGATASSSGRDARAARWRSCTSRSSTR